VPIWEYTLGRVREDGLWFGLGITTDDSVVISPERFDHPHSLYLAVLFQGGIIGLIGFLLILAAATRKLLRFFDEIDSKLALSVLLLALPAYALDGHELIDNVGVRWFLISLPIAVAVWVNWRDQFRFVPA
jgi:O-antigen ligase